MELRDIEYFATVAEHKSIGRAAEALDMSQPALSKSLRRLEQAMGAKVVQRTAKGVELTAVGSALLSQAHRLRLTMDDISREAADLRAGLAGHIRVGTSPGYGPFVSLAAEALLIESPMVNLKIETNVFATLATGLHNGTLDVIVQSQAPAGADITEIPLFDEEYVVYVSANHRLAQHKKLRLADLVNERWAMSGVNNPALQRLTRVFRAAGLPAPVIGLEAADLQVRQHLVAKSELITFGSKEIARHATNRHPVVALQVKDLKYPRHVRLFHRSEAYLPPVAWRFIEILKATGKKITSESQ